MLLIMIAMEQNWILCWICWELPLGFCIFCLQFMLDEPQKVIAFLLYMFFFFFGN